jgi:antitoxin component of MazEF toxin-antitoxin module
MSLTIERRLINDGGSTVLVIPKEWKEATGVKTGSLVELELDDSSLTIRPKKAK